MNSISSNQHQLGFGLKATYLGTSIPSLLTAKREFYSKRTPEVAAEVKQALSAARKDGNKVVIGLSAESSSAGLSGYPLGKDYGPILNFLLTPFRKVDPKNYIIASGTTTEEMVKDLSEKCAKFFAD